MRCLSTLATLLVGLTFVFWVPTARAAIVDQENLPIDETSAGFNAADETLFWQQEVISGVSGTLTSVEFFVANIVGDGQFNFFVNIGSPWQTDSHDFAVSLTGLAPGTFVVDTSSAGITLAAGDTFVLGWQGAGDQRGVGLFGSFIDGGVDQYVGELWGDNPFNPPQLHSGGVGGWDIGFRTFMEPPGPALVTDTCDIGSGPNDIETVSASYDGNNDEIVVEMVLCAVVDKKTKYRVFFDHTAPFFDEADRNGDGIDPEGDLNDLDFCFTTSDDTMMHRYKKDTGPGSRI